MLQKTTPCCLHLFEARLPLGLSSSQLRQHPGLDQVGQRAVLGLGDGLHRLVDLDIEGDANARLTGRHRGVARCDEV
jgi:hypothetical protein